MRQTLEARTLQREYIEVHLRTECWAVESLFCRCKTRLW